MIRQIFAAIPTAIFYAIMGTVYFILLKIDQIFKTTIITKNQRKLFKIYGWNFKVFAFFAGIKVTTKGFENYEAKPSVILLNHQSNLDPWLCVGFLPVTRFSVVAKKELKSVPFMKTFGKALNGQFIDRENPIQALKAIRHASKDLTKGDPFLIFPEGTRSKSDNLGKIKSGYTIPIKKYKIGVDFFKINNSFNSLEGRKLFSWQTKILLEYKGHIEYAKIDLKQFDQFVAERLK